MPQNPGAYDPETQQALSLWIVLNRTHAALTRVIEADIRARGFSLTEWGVLELLYHKGPQPMGNLGTRILISSGSVTYVVDKLAERGLVERRPCLEDRRVTYAVLTPAGEALIARGFPHHAEAIRQALSALTPAEQETVRTLLKRLGLSVQPPPLPS